MPVLWHFPHGPWPHDVMPAWPVFTRADVDDDEYESGEWEETGDGRALA
jgi:hypothetical protein